MEILRIISPSTRELKFTGILFFGCVRGHFFVTKNKSYVESMTILCRFYIDSMTIHRLLCIAIYECASYSRIWNLWRIYDKSINFMFYLTNKKAGEVDDYRIDFLSADTVFYRITKKHKKLEAR